MSNISDQSLAIVQELEMISESRFKSFESLPRSMSALEKAAAEIIRLRNENLSLKSELSELRNKAN